MGPGEEREQRLHDLRMEREEKERAELVELREKARLLETMTRQYEGMKGERDGEQRIAVEWEKKAEGLELQNDALMDALHLAFDWMGRPANELYTEAHLSHAIEQVKAVLKGIVEPKGVQCPRCPYTMPEGGPCTKCGYVVNRVEEKPKVEVCHNCLRNIRCDVHPPVFEKRHDETYPNCHEPGCCGNPKGEM